MPWPLHAASAVDGRVRPACQTAGVPFTLVSFHAHPDDEALLTGGTLARVAAEGHRVVLVTATAGGAGLSSDGTGADRSLADHRRAELAASAESTGVRPVGAPRLRGLRLGRTGRPDGAAGAPPSFSELDPSGPAQRLADLLRDEQADALTIYDAPGRLRPPRPRPGAPGRGARRRAGRHARGARGDRRPGTSAAGGLGDAVASGPLTTRSSRGLRHVVRRQGGADPRGGRPGPPRREARCPRSARLAGHRGHVRPDADAAAAPSGSGARSGAGSGVVPRAGPVPGGPLLDDVFASLR